MRAKSHRLLFLCTGNYYRSRFAEMLFNQVAEEANLKWSAESRGIAVELGSGNVGPISLYAIDALRSRKIFFRENLRYPVQLQELDLAQADLIIALNEIEHRSLLKRRFPKWPERVEYWNIPDLPASPKETILRIEQKIRILIRQPSMRAPGESGKKKTQSTC